MFRNWALSLNDRIEDWLDSVDWYRVDRICGTVGGCLFIGAVFYFLYILAVAHLAGAFERTAIR